MTTLVQLVDHDPRWPERYRVEAAVVEVAIGTALVALEHVGSTAVPGLRAKPIIDILAAVACFDDFDAMVDRLAAAGYRYTPESEADDPARRVFRKDAAPDGARTHHLHVTLAGSRYWRRIVAFRDHLRDHPDDAAAYVALKESLAARHADAPRRYTAGKHELVTAIERKAGVPPRVGRFSDLHPRRAEAGARG